MENILEATYYGNTVFAWLQALAVIVLALIVGKTVYWVFQNVVKKLTAKTKTRLDDIVLDMVEEPLVVILTVLGFWYALGNLSFESDNVRDFIGDAMRGAITLSVTWMVARLVDALFREYLVPLSEKSETDLDDQLLPILRKGTRLAIWALGAIVALNNAGYNVGALVAGLGVGGLALAIAAQDTVANIFGSATIFIDRPFALNDRIRIEGYDGVVRDIGLRSTRLETRDGPMVTIPNSIFTSTPVENITTGPEGRRVVLRLGLTYDTSAERLERALAILNEIAAAVDGVTDNLNISFSTFDDFALVLRCAYFVRPGASFRGVQSTFNLEVRKRFDAEGLEFAFPTRTIHTVGDGAAVAG